jgi:steroid 5-alpha reductase family enzyme
MIIWMSFYLLASSAPGGWTTLYAPAIIIFLLIKVTGIPPAEAASLQSKGDAYRKYQEKTSMFIPWFSQKS